MRAPLAVLAAPLLLLTSCSSGPAPDDAADRAFLQQMLPHHRAAVAAGALARDRGSDPRVRAFGQRVLDEQQPEIDRMQALAARLHLRLDETRGARTAMGLIDTTRLTALRGAAFDRAFLSLSVTSEGGAAQMAQQELVHGTDADAKALARPIAGAPHSEIPELQALLDQLA